MRHFIFLLLLPFTCIAQSKYDSLDFSTIDAFAKTIKYERRLDKLSQDLTKPYSKDIEKVRSIFIWITDNIKYDVKSFNNGTTLIEPPNCENVVDCSETINAWERNFLDRVIRRKKAVCSGYSMLFKYLCNCAGISCEVVPGYTKTEDYQIGVGFSVEHAWNVVYIDSQYYHLDATWAAGGCSRKRKEPEKLKKFYKKYNNYYWLTPFNKFVRNHSPENGRWVFEKNYTLQKFSNAPYYSSKVIADFELFSPKSEFLEVEVGDTIHFNFSYNGILNKLQMNTSLYSNPYPFLDEGTELIFDKESLQLQKYITYKKTDKVYEFDYIVTSTSLYYIDLLFDYKLVFRTKLKTTIKK